MLCKGVEVERDEQLDFDALYTLTGPRLWRAILAYTGGRRELTDDVVAEAFTRTLEQGRDVRDPESYLFRVAFRLAAAELRRPAVNNAIPESPIWDDPGLTELFDAFGHLSPGQRAAVFLRYQGTTDQGGRALDGHVPGGCSDPSVPCATHAREPPWRRR